MNNISGFFGSLQGAKIYDLTIENANVAPANFSGVLSAYAKYAAILNCTVKNSTVNYNYFSDTQSSGAICGEAWYSSVSYCNVEGNTIYGKCASEFISVQSIYGYCTQKSNKVYATKSLSVFDEANSKMSNLSLFLLRQTVIFLLKCGTIMYEFRHYCIA